MTSKNSLCDERLFEQFYKKNFQLAHHFIFYKTGNTSDANDIVQEAFSNLWQHCSTIKFSTAKSYLFTVMNNLFFNQKKHEKVIFNYAKETPYYDVDCNNPEYILEEEEFKKNLLLKIQALPTEAREVFLLNRIDGKKYREIAEILNISQKTVERRMSVAIKKLNLKTKFSK